jgi:hypothetical protein
MAAPGLPFHKALSITTTTSPVAPVTLGRVRVNDESPHEAMMTITGTRINAGVLIGIGV